MLLSETSLLIRAADVAAYLHKDDAGVMCCAEVLTTPVIHEHHAKDVFVGFLDGNGLPELIPSSNKEGLIIRVQEKHSSNEILIYYNIEYHTDWQKATEKDNSDVEIKLFQHLFKRYKHTGDWTK